MVRILWLTALAVALLHTLFAQTVSSEMDAGVEAYKSAMYERAIAHFRKATELDPNLAAAHMYLATAYAQMYIPGAESPDNLQNAENSLAEFERALEANPPPDQRMHMIQSLASLNFNLKRFDEARKYYHQIVELDPQDAEAYYSLAVIDWTEAYVPHMDLRQSTGLQPADLMTSTSGCNLLRSMNQEKVEDGISNLKKALDIRCDYDDGLLEPTIPREGRLRVRRPSRARGRPETGRRMGRSHHGHQEGQSRENNCTAVKNQRQFRDVLMKNPEMRLTRATTALAPPPTALANRTC